MAVAEALTNKHEQVDADKEGTLGASVGDTPGVGEEDAPGFVLSSAARRQGLKPIRAAPTTGSTAPRALSSRPSSSRMAMGSEAVS